MGTGLATRLPITLRCDLGRNLALIFITSDDHELIIPGGDAVPRLQLIAGRA